MRRIATLIALLLLLGSLMPGCPESAKQDLLQVIRSRGKLLVGMEPSYPPFEWTAEDGSYIGFDVELARAIAQAIGVELEIVETKWDGIIPSLLTGKIDCIISGMSVTDERAQRVAFSTPYYRTGQAVLLHRDSAGRSIESLNAPGVKIVVKTGTTGQYAAQAAFDAAELLEAPEPEATLANMVRNKQADAMVFDHIGLARIVKRYDDLVLAPGTLTEESLAVAMRKPDQSLIDLVNTVIATMREDGRYEALHAKFLTLD